MLWSLPFFWAGQLIPYVGPTIGLIPMIITYAFTDMDMMIKAVIYMLIIQQIDGNILLSAYCWRRDEGSPDYHYGSLIALSNIYGIIGMVVAIPVYSIGERNCYLVNLYDNHRAAKEQKKKRRIWNH